ncbi:MAG: baseplate J/gp47 family protein [Eubacterium sp.]|nr:baseplate J/gp47 family protein [Eubacterium sp.]
MGVKEIKEFPDVSFIDNMTMEDIQSYYLNAMQERYRQLTGRELVMHDADPIRLVAYADCLLLYQMAQYAERAGKMALLKYSFGDYLENIGAFKGTSRQQGSKAKTRLRFTLSDKRFGTTVIPAGTRVTASDGIYFSTVDILEIPAGDLAGEVNAECHEIGTKGNGYSSGILKVLVDPVPYVCKVENVTVSDGGADLESDDNLAERIYLAPSSWSVAGPDDAYKYWVRTFDAAISDVAVDSEIPGEVDICFILQGGKIPEPTLLEELSRYLQNEEIRPLTDKVVVSAPVVEEYEMDLVYYINRSDRARTASINENVMKAAADYSNWQKEKIGRDINPDQLRRMVMSAGAKRLEIRSPSFQKISKKSIAVLKGNMSVVYGGIEDD